MVELMLVVAVLGIIGALALPMFTGTDVTKLKAAARVLASDIDAARAESIAHGEDPRVLVLDDTHHAWHLAAASDPDTPIRHADTGRPYARTLGVGPLRQLDGVRIHAYDLDTDSQTNDHRLGFGLYGQTDQASDPTITLAAGNNTLTLTIHATTGEVTIGDIN